MSSSHLRRKKSCATTRCRFLSVIQDDTSRDRKLGIPKSFLDKYGEDLSNNLNQVLFKLPCGWRWEIGLTSFNGEVWFRKKWQDFSKFYCLEKGDLLLFEYEGDCTFQVSILDGNSNMEIDYTRRVLGSEEVSLEISGDVQPSVVSRKINRPVLSSKESNVKAEKPVKHWSKSKTKAYKDGFPAKKYEEGTFSTHIFRKQTPEGLGRAESSKTSFRVTLCSPYISQDFLWLPEAFTEKLLLKLPSNGMLRVSGGRGTWPVLLIYEKAKRRVKFHSGWSEFVRDTNLKDGDVCEFVLMDCSRPRFEVTIETREIDHCDDEDEEEDEGGSHDASINRLSKRRRICSRTENLHEARSKAPRRMHHASSGKDMATEKDNGFISTTPQFKVQLKPSYIYANYLYVPIKFAKIYLCRQPRRAFLRSGSERTWSVDFCYKSSKATFQSGWGKFIQDNYLKAGDACVFLLTDTSKFVFDVVISRAT